MSKKLRSLLLVMCIAVIALTGLTACGKDSDPNEPQKLTAPVVSLAGNVASWEANSNADKFEISLDGNLSYVENTITSKTLLNGQSLKVRAVGDGTSFTTSDWSNTVIYTATPQPSKLNAPIVTVSNTGLASWALVSSASGYVYKINGGAETPATTTFVQLVDGQNIVVKAVGDGVNYIDSDYSQVVTYSAGNPIPQPTKLSAPSVTISNTGLASWVAVANAVSYEYKINGGNAVPTTATSVQLTNGQNIVVRAIGDGVNYSDSDYSTSKTYTQTQSQVQEPEYLGIFASSVEPNAQNGLPEALNPVPAFSSYGELSQREPRSLEDLLEEHFENTDNYLGTNYPAESNFDIYSRAGNQIYIQIWLNNPNQHTILSLKLNGTKYQVGGGLSSFFIEQSGVHYNCVYVAVTIPNQTYVSKDYVVSEIEYIEGTYINADGTDTFMNENDTISVGLPYTSQNPQVTNYQETSVTINSYSATFNFTDAQNLLGLSGGWAGVAVYDSYELVYNQAVTVGNNTLTATGLVENSEYRIIIYIYADLHDGYGVRPYGISYNFVFTPEVIEVNEIDGAIVLNAKETGYIGAVKVDTTLSSNTAQYVKLEILDKNNVVVYTDTEFDGNAVVTEGILNGTNYTVRVHYKDNEYPQGKYIDRWIYVDKLTNPSIVNGNYYAFVNDAIYSFEISSYNNKFADVDSFVVRFFDDESASYIAEDVLYLIDNPNAVDELWTQWGELRSQLSNYDEDSEEFIEISNQMQAIYNMRSRLQNVQNDWENNFDSNSDKAFWQTELAKGKYVCSYSYAGTDTENIFKANGRYYVILENINDKVWYDIEIVAQLAKNETTENDGLVEEVYTPGTSGLSLKNVFNEQNFDCTEILEGASLDGDEFIFTLHNSHDRRIGNSGETSSSEKKQYIYRIEANGRELYLNDTIQTYEIDEEAWVEEYITNAKAGTLDVAALYQKYLPNYSEEIITLDYTNIDAGKYTFWIQTRMYNKEYEEGEREDFIEVQDMEIFKQLANPTLTVEGNYGYIVLPQSTSIYDIRLEAYDSEDNPITLTYDNVEWHYYTNSYRFEFAYVDAKVRVKLSKIPLNSGEGDSNTETVYWFDSEWTEYVDSDSTYLTSPTVTSESYSRRVIFTFTNNELQNYFQKFVYTINDGEEKTGEYINFNYYEEGTYTIKVKAVVNNEGKQTGYCDSEWVTYSYTNTLGGDKEK